MPPVRERLTSGDSATDAWRVDPPERNPAPSWTAHTDPHTRLSAAWRTANTGLAQLTPRQPVAFEVLFEDLADEWMAATAFESVVTRMAMHPAYQHIIGLGGPAVPLLLRRLQREPLQWFWALKAITREDPAEGTMTVDDAADAWLRWGHARGLIGA